MQQLPLDLKKMPQRLGGKNAPFGRKADKQTVNLTKEQSMEPTKTSNGLTVATSPQRRIDSLLLGWLLFLPFDSFDR